MLDLVSFSLLDRMEDPSSRLQRTPRGFNAEIHTSPPYVTAKPDVAMRSLQENKDAKGQLKFIISATDGRMYIVNSRDTYN